MSRTSGNLLVCVHLLFDKYSKEIWSIMKKLTTVEFIERARTIHDDTYDYSLTQYVNAHTKVIVICSTHGPFQATVYAKGHYGCPKCSGHDKTNNEFILECKAIHGDQYDYSQTAYTKVSKPVNIICRIHGPFTQNADMHRRGNGCPKCAGRHKTIEDIINMSKEIHGDKYDYSKVSHSSTQNKIEIICLSHGSFFQTIPNHINKKQGCKKCALARAYTTTTKTRNQFLIEANALHGDRYDYSNVNYINGDTKVEIICRVHGSFFQSGQSHVGGRGCRRCNIGKSKVEKEWLDYLQIENRQVTLTFPNQKCIVDGYDYATRTVYEFYGDYWHGNPNTMKPDKVNVFTGETMAELYRKTLDREQLLRSSGYTIVSIWEADWKLLKQSL